jgi:Tol biopolymer transport system component
VVTARRHVFVVLAVAACSMFGAVKAEAAFPGANGKIAFTSGRNGGYSIFTMNGDGSNQTQITGPAGNIIADSQPTWSPDGTKIAFQSFRDHNSEIYVMNPDGTNQTRITNSSAADAEPAWSPDGTKIVFEMVIDSNFEIFTMNADGTNQTRLTTNTTRDVAPAWSPDGTKIAFQTLRDGNSEIYTMNADGTNQAPITNNPAEDADPSWSPDGTRIAFDSDRDGSSGFSQIYTMNADGTNQTQLTDLTDAVLPSWSPDGTRIAFQAFPTGQYEVYTMNADGTNQTRHTTNTLFDGWTDWQPIPYTGYPRPKGATPLRVPFVPAFTACTAPGNRTHGAPLAFPSCAPPVQESSYLTVGTPDANGAAANSTGSMLIKVTASDIITKLTITDVRCRPGTDASVCGTPNAAGGPDYTGEIQANMTIRITDHYNGPALNEAATVQDLPNPISATCASTGDTSLGSTCTVTACATCVGPPRSDIPGQRTVVGISQVGVYDGGSDGLASTSGDNTLFMNQGIFIP